MDFVACCIHRGIYVEHIHILFLHIVHAREVMSRANPPHQWMRIQKFNLFWTMHATDQLVV